MRVDDAIPDDPQRQADLGTALYFAAVMLFMAPLTYVARRLRGKEPQTAMEAWHDAVGVAWLLFWAFPCRRIIGQITGLDPVPRMNRLIFGQEGDR